MMDGADVVIARRIKRLCFGEIQLLNDAEY